MTNREVATAVIARRLGISPDHIKDDTPLGDAWSEIIMLVCFKTATTVVGNVGMTAGDVLKQIR